jgi:N-acetylated-alpha-linked acidic dipeptidase
MPLRPPAVLAAALLAAAGGRPRQAPADLRLGYARESGARQRAAEAAAIARPAPTAPRATPARSRASRTSPAPRRRRARATTCSPEMRRFGLQVETRAYEVYLPHATGVRVWRLAPAGRAGDSAELDLPRAPWRATPRRTCRSTRPSTATPPRATSPRGGVRELRADRGLRALDSLGRVGAGKVAVARYGRSFRGIKAREAERHGAVALIIYSDPADDGFARGDVYPEGPMRPPQGVQRGSVFNGNGDPSTPGYASVQRARRVSKDSMRVPRIPVIPMSYGNAAELLREVRGAKLPAQTWQGGLPFRYHVGPGPVRARVQVATDEATRAYKTIWNTFGTIRGTDFPTSWCSSAGTATDGAPARPTT